MMFFMISERAFKDCILFHDDSKTPEDTRFAHYVKP